MAFQTRVILLALLDSTIVTFTIFLAAWIVYPNTAVASLPALIISAISLLVFHHLFAIIYKLYNKIWAYASVGELIVIVKAVTFSIVAAGIVQYLVNDFSIYKRALLVTWMFHILLIGGSRFMWRILRDRYITSYENKKRTLIIGAGSAGTMIVRQLQNNHSDGELLPVAFIDDDVTKQKMQIYGIPVLGKAKHIPAVVEKHNIEHIVIAIPSLRNGALNKVVEECNRTNVKVQMIPKIEDIMTGKVSVSQLKNIDVGDLLGREPVELDIHAISEYVTGKTVLVTGAGGSIGSEICRQLMRFSPARIVLVGHGEYSIYSIDMELKEKFGELNIEIVPVIGDVQDRERIVEIVNQYKPTIIYHAAAHKHVPLMEFNPHEAVKNNVIGTRNVAEAADRFNVGTFVMVSSDKAVNPTNVMGATKRVAEMVVQDLSSRSSTKFVAVRFGNVLGSRGSVIPLFEKQIARGGPITVTHPEITRYFMTIPEASRLVIQAGTLARGGEIFVLDMGEPVKIVDLAKNLIKLSGFTEDEIEIHYTGMRPGEKMYEELLSEGEIYPKQVFDKIYIGKTNGIDNTIVEKITSEFHQMPEYSLKEELIKIANSEYGLKEIVGS